MGGGSARGAVSPEVIRYYIYFQGGARRMKEKTKMKNCELCISEHITETVTA